MRALIEVIDGGIGNSIQDRGRLGFRHMGITVSGWIDPMLARCANALVGNEADCACVEIRGAGPTLVAREGRFRVVLTGDVSALLTKENGATREVPAWTSFTLEANDTLEVGYIAGGTAYLAVGGGIDTPLQLGSRSTYQRALTDGGSMRRLDWNVLRQQAGAPGIEYSFRYFQQVEGDIVLPRGIRPVRVVVRLLPASGAPVEQSFTWSAATAPAGG